jgi:hypothetical protein
MRALRVLLAGDIGGELRHHKDDRTKAVAFEESAS